jgi:FMN reductase
MITIVSSSLNSDSKSRRLAVLALEFARGLGTEANFIDLRDYPLELCDGDKSYSHPNVSRLSAAFSRSSTILLASPVYNYDVSAALKNVVEHVGDQLSDKVVGLMCAAGGERSYMSPLSFLNTLMIDFRSIIVPRFVYAPPRAFGEDGALEEGLHDRIRELVVKAVSMATALHGTRA